MIINKFAISIPTSIETTPATIVAPTAIAAVATRLIFFFSSLSISHCSPE
jgi:hypothetical protein